VAAAGLSGLAVFEVLRVRPDHPFRDGRFTFFIFILIPVQTLFAHVWLTVPYYLDRAFRGSVVSDYFEFFSNINPILIFILAPIVAGLTARANVYTMMIIGTLVMALPTFLLAIGPHLIPFLAYVLLMSIGEAMWQPRFLQWIAEVAPPGKTGLYMGIGQFPWFLTKFVTGLYSGYFVAKYIPKPETGLPMNTEFMWLVYAFIAMISPVALILARKWMMAGMKEKHESA
jgi:MFS family permease